MPQVAARKYLNECEPGMRREGCGKCGSPNIRYANLEPEFFEQLMLECGDCGFSEPAASHVRRNIYIVEGGQ